MPFTAAPRSSSVEQRVQASGQSPGQTSVPLPVRLQAWLDDRSPGGAGPDPSHDRGALLRALVAAGLAELPLPGAGGTLERWRCLAAVAGFDLALVKLYEGHTDAVAILAEAAAHESFHAPAREPDTASRSRTWGVWAAEAPGARVVCHEGDVGGQCRLEGTKAWCSGAGGVDGGLMTAWVAGSTAPQLVTVELDQPGVSFDASGWRAIGMAHSESIAVGFEGVAGRPVGPRGFYLDRPGFWQGGAGIAACWHGGARGLADVLHRQVRHGAGEAAWHKLLALGAVDVALSSSAAQLRAAAAWIDGHPHANARLLALRTRAAAELAAEVVLRQVTRALGATPLCRDSAFAQRAADLPVFIRQSHGDRDLVALGERVADEDAAPWTL